MRGSLRIYYAFMLVALCAVGCSSNRHEFRRPIAVDFDMEDIAEPAEDRASQYYDILDRTFTKQIHQGFDMPRNFRKIAGRPKQAENVDAFGNVPNSSWFTNRNGKTAMSIDEIRRGPNRGDGPAPGTWTVTRGKTQGVTPGFTIRDASGDLYIIKFDPPGNPEMSTAAEVISTKLFYAMGYNTPQNRIVYFEADRLRVDAKANIVDPLGRKRTMTQADLDRILERVYRRPDGKFRAVASKFLSGKPKGPFSYHGTRKDDPNDIIPHEHRRDLRGLRLMGAWLEHNDIRRINSLDMYTEEDGRHFMRHYLIDFGATLGSASLFPNLAREGHEYIFDHWETQKSLYTLGLYKRRWLDAEEVEYPTVGYFESELFNPAKWKPNYPNPAFENMTNLDALWATKIIMSFTDEQIRAAVAAGELSDAAAAEYLSSILIERRDKIARHWYGKVNAIDDFAIQGKGVAQSLTFRDLQVNAGFHDRAATRYRYRLTHNACDATPTLLDELWLDGSAIGDSPGIDLEPIRSAAGAASSESGDRCDRYFFLTFWTERDGVENNGKWVKVHLYWLGAAEGFELVGVEHQE